MPLELEYYGSFVTGHSVIDLENIIYVSEVKKYVGANDQVRMWSLEYQMYGVSEVRKIECVEKKYRIWHLFVQRPEPAGRIYQLQEFLVHHVKINLKK